MAFFGIKLIHSFLLGALLVDATPILEARQSFSTLSTAEIAAFKPFTFYASTAYCQPAQTLAWTCGANCDANPTFKPIASGGDGTAVQFWYVGVDPTLKTIVVGHQGTNPEKIMPLITDADLFLDHLDPTLFPGIDAGIEVHNGFAKEHAKTATQVLSAVQTGLATSGLNDVTIVGHSLGAALALLDGVYLPLNLPNVNFKTIGYGMPRVGNQAFANYVDAHVTLSHVNNLQDVVPTLPGRFLGFHHPQGEKHIQEDLSWVSCPGQDNTDGRCTTGDVKNIFEGNIKDHSGPYDGVTMGC
ncbi:lipase class 3 family protein [Collybia nuda]|uniref:Lipase class 3 family protein n=1 Tax=Collybia nuda TaxID=64659 RepID=A0A9P5Y9R2_9AGAR|nr:lipase class 3 family protein [Collybia nuda]